jgi:hypothetical protein
MEPRATDHLKQILLYPPRLLSFESPRDFRQLDEEIRRHICPQDILDEIWTCEIVEGEWETLRLRRHKVQLVRLAKLDALRTLLRSISADTDDDEIDELARRSFTNKAIRNQVNSSLRSIGLDESAVEAEAYRSSIADLMAIDRRLVELAVRRDKIFRQIEDRRAGIAVPVGHRSAAKGVQIDHDGAS